MKYRPNTVEWLFSLENFDTFVEEYWQQKPFVISDRGTGFYDEILTSDELTNTIEQVCKLATSYMIHNNTAPLLELVGGESSAGDTKLRHSASDITEVMNAYNSGSSVLLRSMHHYCASLSKLCDAIQLKFGSPVNSTFIQTPKNTQAFGRHFDATDSLILQLDGKKNWRLFDSGSKLPLERVPGLPFESFEDMHAARRAVGRKIQDTEQIIQEIELNPGDLLYVPRGVNHDVWTTDCDSSHITIAIQPVTYMDLVNSYLRKFASNNVSIRERLPIKIWDSDTHDIMSSKLKSILSDLADSDLVQEAIEELEVPYNSSIVEFKLNDDHDVNSRIDLYSKLELVAAGSPKITLGETNVVLQFGERKFTMPISMAPALELIISKKYFCAADLPGISDTGSLTFCKRLLRAHVIRDYTSD